VKARWKREVVAVADLTTARGRRAHYSAIYKAAALHAGEIAGAGLDTFEEEPKVSAALRAEPRAFLLPHIASATDETRFNMSERSIANARAVLDGGAPINPINAPAAVLETLSADDKARVTEYITQEFAYEKALEELGGVYAEAAPAEVASARL
jgi:hypothetical protein